MTRSFSINDTINNSNSNSTGALLLDDALAVPEGGQTLYLAFPTTALQHACESIRRHVSKVRVVSRLITDFAIRSQ